MVVPRSWRPLNYILTNSNKSGVIQISVDVIINVFLLFRNQVRVQTYMILWQIYTKGGQRCSRYMVAPAFWGGTESTCSCKSVQIILCLFLPHTNIISNVYNFNCKRGTFCCVFCLTAKWGKTVQEVHVCKYRWIDT